MGATYKLKHKKADGTIEDVALQGQVHFIPKDSFTVVTGSYNPTKWSVTDVNGITTPTDGLTIAVRTPNGGATYGILLSIDDSSNFYPIVRNGSARVTTNYPQNSTLILTFNATQTVSVNLGSSTTTTVTGCWQIADYYADYLVSQYNTTTSGNYPLLFKYGVGTTTTTDYTRFADNIYVNPSTGTIYANDFVVDGKSIVGGGDGTDYDNVYVGGTTSIEYDGDGITWDGVIELISDDGLVEKPITVAIPLVVGDGIEFTPNSAGDRIVISATNTGGGSSSGGGQPLYRHCIKVYEAGSDSYEIFLQIVSASASPINTEEQLIAALGEGEHPCICSGTFNLDGSSYRACVIFKYDGDGEYHIYTDVNLEGYHIPLFGDRYYALSITDTVNLIGTASVSGSGGVAQLQQSVAYAELKALRDNGELVAGMQYRITDFVTTTSQTDTQSAGHPFDIIVTALSNNTLSENASADYHIGSGGGATFDPSVLADEDGNLDQNAVVAHYYIYEDIEGPGEEGPVEGYKAMDIFVAYDYLENNDGVTVPVIYKNDVEGYGEEGPDYQDIFYYDGTMEVDGVTYDKWRKICETQENGPFWDGRTGYIWALTNVIVNSGSAVDLYFANSKLPAWEIKYCLDNDKTRFAWAVVGDYWISTDFGEKDYILNEKITIDGQEFFKTTHDSVFSLVSQPKTTKELYVYNSTSGELVTFEEDGSAIYDWGEENAGKGVIYYIKDEWDNECPYDFKNIQFKRSTDWFAEHGDWGENVLGYTPTEDKWFYTFTWVDENDEPQDLTLIGNSLLNDEGKINGVFGNKIGICDEYQIYFGENSVEALSYNVFVSSYYCEGGIFYGCYSNTFGNDCNYNTFGNECYSNTFGNGCSSNTFSNLCSSNTFGNGCSKNTLSEYAFCNIFENGVVFVDLTSTTQGNDENRLQYITVSQGVTGAASTRKTINATRNLAYKTTYVAQGSVTTEV